MLCASHSYWSAFRKEQSGGEERWDRLKPRPLHRWMEACQSAHSLTVTFAHWQGTQTQAALITPYDSSFTQWWDPICCTANKPRWIQSNPRNSLPFVKEVPCCNVIPGGQCFTQVPLSPPTTLSSPAAGGLISTGLKSWLLFILRDHSDSSEADIFFIRGQIKKFLWVGFCLAMGYEGGYDTFLYNVGANGFLHPRSKPQIRPEVEGVNWWCLLKASKIASCSYNLSTTNCLF